MKTYFFPRGGISYEDPFAPSRSSSVTAFLPGLAVIPLIQHPGGKAIPVVSPGETVKEGMLIGRARGPLSANVHATVPGRVLRLVSWTMCDGELNEALLIQMEGEFEKLGKKEEVYPWAGLGAHELLGLIDEYGIVEMEGAGFPLMEVLSSPASAPPSSLVVRCVFDDPWLAADYVLCKERLSAVVEGAAITARAAGAERLVFAVSRKESTLGKELLACAAAWDIPSSLAITGARYPQRNRRELELVLRDYGKREGLDLGSLIIEGPATLAAVRDAVKLRKPILDRYVAVGGSALRSPKVMKARIGTRIGEIFEGCGGFSDSPRLIATGSPLRGRQAAALDEPVIKATTAVFALSEDAKRITGNCIGCGGCRVVCPVGLDPEDLYKRALSARELSPGRAGECHGCGCCELVCPSNLPLSSVIIAFDGDGGDPAREGQN